MVVIKKIEMPYAKEVHLISQQSLTQVSNYFKNKFHEEPMHIGIVEKIDKQSMTVINEHLQKTIYHK